MTTRVLCVAGCVLPLLLAACVGPGGEAEPAAGCAAGQVETCACPDGEGTRTCGEDGSFGACDCPPVEEVEPALECDVDRIDFGVGFPGQEQRREVVCVNRSAGPWVLAAGPITGRDAEAFGVAPLADTPVPPGGTWTVVVTSTPSRPGALEAVLPLASAGGRAVGRISLAARVVDHAIGCGPVVIDFGMVPPGGSAHAQVHCSNASTLPLAITGLALDPSSHQRFTWTPDDAPIAVPPTADGIPGSVTIDVAFAPLPDDAGYRKNGILIVTTDDRTAPRVDIQLTGFAGGPAVSCSPARLDFGQVASGLPATRSFTCVNTGADDPSRTDDDLFVEAVETSNPEFTALVRGGLDAEGYAVGETFTVDVTYVPADDGLDGASVRIVSNDTLTGPAAPHAVAVSGLGRVFPPCDFELAPGDLRFGNVGERGDATLEFELVNHSCDVECLVQDLRLEPGCAAFSLPAGPVWQQVLPPGAELRVPVRFAPEVEGSYACEVRFDITNPDQPHQVVAVSGVSTPSCGLVARELDFGTVKPGCATRDRELQVLNTCASPLVLDRALIDQVGEDEFFIRSCPPAGMMIQPGLSMYLTVAYRPVDEGADRAALRMYLDGEAEPLLVTLRSSGGLDALQTDHFEQDDRATDVLWVIDNAGSMAPEQGALAANIGSFLSYPLGQSLDFHLGVTSTGLVSAGACPGGATGGEDGRLVPVDGTRPRILDANTPNLAATLAANLAVGSCGYQRLAMEAAYRALVPPLADTCDDPRHPEANDGNCGFLRRDARLAVIAVTDGVDASPGTVNFYFNALGALKGLGHPELLQVHAITGDPGVGCGSAAAGDKLIGLAEQTGGTFHSICTADWAGELQELSSSVFGRRSCFPLSNLPEDTNGNGIVSDVEGELEVRLDGTVISSHGPGGQVAWEFRRNELSVCFAPLFVPDPGAQLDVSYRTACLSW